MNKSFSLCLKHKHMPYQTSTQTQLSLLSEIVVLLKEIKSCLEALREDEQDDESFVESDGEELLESNEYGEPLRD